MGTKQLKKLSNSTKMKIEAIRDQKIVEPVKKTNTLTDFLTKLFKNQTQAITAANEAIIKKSVAANKEKIVPNITKELGAIQKKIKLNEAAKKREQVLAKRDAVIGNEINEFNELINLATKHKIINPDNSKEVQALKYNLRKSPEEYKAAILNEIAAKTVAQKKVYFHDPKNSSNDIASDIYERMRNGKLEQELSITPVIDNIF